MLYTGKLFNTVPTTEVLHARVFSICLTPANSNVVGYLGLAVITQLILLTSS